MITKDLLSRLHSSLLGLVKEKPQCPFCGSYVNLTFYSSETLQQTRLHMRSLHKADCPVGELIKIAEKNISK